MSLVEADKLSKLPAPMRGGAANTVSRELQGGAMSPAWGSPAPSPTRWQPASRAREPEEPPTQEQRAFPQLNFREEGGGFTVETSHGVAARQRFTVRPAGQIVLFHRVMEQWALNDDDAAKLLGFPTPRIIRELYAGLGGLDQRDAQDRLRAVIKIASLLHAVYGGSLAAIRSWLAASEELLGNQSPVDLLREGSMENVIRVRQLVEHMAGR